MDWSTKSNPLLLPYCQKYHPITIEFLGRQPFFQKSNFIAGSLLQTNSVL